MKHISTLYRNMAQFKTFIEENEVDIQRDCVARVVTSNLSRGEIRSLIADMTELIPKVSILGMTSSSAVIHNSSIEEGQTMISLAFYDSLTLTKHRFTYKNRAVADIAHEINQVHRISAEENATVQILINTGFLYITELLEELNKEATPIQLAGAVVGMLPDEDLGFIFDETGIYDDVIMTWSLEGSVGRHFISTNLSYEVIQDSVQEITKISHDLIEEVNGISAKEWLFDYLGVTNYDYALSDELLTHFPIVMEDGLSSRFLHYNPENEGVYIHHETSLFVGTKFRKGCISPTFTVENTHKSILAMVDTPIESIFLCACFFRKIYLSNCIEWELKPFANFNVCGMFAMGEIVFADGKNILHHGASIFTAIAEQEKYIVPLVEELSDKKLIYEATYHLHHLIEQAIPEYADDILFAMTPYENFDIDYHMVDYVDVHLNVPNMLQYKKDKEKIKFTQICIIEVESADAVIAFLGIDLYYDLCRETMESIKSALGASCDEVIYSYCFNYKTVFFTCTDDISEEVFIELNAQIHDKFKQNTSSSEGQVMLRFVLLSRMENLLENGIKFLFENRDNPETFLVNEAEFVSDNDDIHMVDVMNWALEHDKIVPYYQGLYHNTKKTVDKYESLMRIMDKQGEVYRPCQFMEIAKKYNLYHKLSLKMVEKVLHDFYDRDEMVAVNLSFSDLQSEHFQVWFFNALKNHNHPDNIIIEIQESDELKRNDTFWDFIKQVRKFGCQIAVDDFGTEHSTFVTVSRMEPDYIKIDGSIIKNIGNDSKSRNLLDTMLYFAEKITAVAVAECVENEEIQCILSEYDFPYSQGYYFSKPMPFHELP